MLRAQAEAIINLKANLLDSGAAIAGIEIGPGPLRKQCSTSTLDRVWHG
jgi:hypothetical protein